MTPFIETPTPSPELLSHCGRIPGYDLARGIAILAMLIINTKAVFSPNDTLPLWLCHGIELMNRRAAVTLVMVAGAGITLLSRKSGLAGKWALLNRALFLFLAGTLLSQIWGADILHFYGVFLVMGLCCLKLSDRRLLAGAGLFWLGGVLRHLDPVVECLEELDPDGIAGYLADLLFYGSYPVFPWATFFLVGMWLGRRDVRDPKFILGMLAAGVLMLSILPVFSLDVDLMSPTPWSIPSGIGTGLCVIALSMHWAALPHRPWVACLSAAGRNTLSLYVLHILFMRAVGLIPGLPAHYGITLAAGGAVGFFIVYMVLVRYWLRRHTRGPLEGLMRRFRFIGGKPGPETGPLVPHGN